MRVAVAVSGGMDSLLSLLLLQESGYEVFAVHGNFLPLSASAEKQSAPLEDWCYKAGIEYFCLDLCSEFESLVISPFAESYRRGLTPNPCAGCNVSLKFGLLFDMALSLGASHFATGHYAMVFADESLPLGRGADLIKDQSYFLCLVPGARLKNCIFPLGRWQKAAVRDELAARGLQKFTASESQEICFIPADDYCSFLESSVFSKNLELPGPGPVVLEDGQKVGEHKGLWRYTQGQRRGLGIAWKYPLYVIDKDINNNQLIVGPESSCTSTGLVAGSVNFFRNFELWPDEVLIQTRYRQRPFAASVYFEDDKLFVRFAARQGLIAPGQVLAIYDNENNGGRVLAGGIIEANLERD